MPRPAPAPAAGVDPGRHSVEQIHLTGGIFTMGDARRDGHPADGETPVHPVQLSPFTIDATPVTNADFEAFVEASGYVTDAERLGFSAVFHLAVAADETDILGQPPEAPWWRGVRGADWRHPGGSHSGISGLGDHPVVHVSWDDAQAYCAWAGRRLPTEAEWEFASRGGVPGARYPWGDDLMARDGSWQANIWQGSFPTHNTCDDGFLTTAPVRSFRPNGYGLWQTVGNVWEWCEDVFSPSTYARDARLGLVSDPRGATAGPLRVMRGGSYLCHDSYCNRYRNAARTSNTPDSSMGNTGFRTVAA
ncbi:MAG TPA: formylglycine-generating enzyme family protein [Propionibacteriaceae bacterium]|nr:formylglycine-generating enzyme family protein [Propionibacteriaceae bacterium]